MIPTGADFAIRSIFSEYWDVPISSLRLHSVGGGSINHTYRLIINNEPNYFCKINTFEKFPWLFEKEKRGIELLDRQQAIRLPEIIGCKREADSQILVMEWIEEGLRTENFWLDFGQQLARLHQIHNPFFGLDEDNYMGALAQSNKPTTQWIEFLMKERLMPQVSLALNNKLLDHGDVKQFEKLYGKLSDIFSEEPPSLLHGDLWSGNFLADDSGNPVLIDPAVYFGHRSMDLGMTTLFGGFDKNFYESYNYYFPFPNNYREQWEICNLYPLLIHLNLFGKGYQNDIVQTIGKY